MDCEISAELTNANQTLPLAKLGENKFRIDSKSWFLPTQVQLWAQPVYPSLHTDQQVLMIAFRWSQHAESIGNLFEVRANLKCDQHYVYSDPHLATQDIPVCPLNQASR